MSGFGVQNDGNVMQRLVQGNNVPLPNEIVAEAPKVVGKDDRGTSPFESVPSLGQPSPVSASNEQSQPNVNAPTLSPAPQIMQPPSNANISGGFGVSTELFQFNPTPEQHRTNQEPQAHLMQQQRHDFPSTSIQTPQHNFAGGNGETNLTPRVEETKPTITPSPFMAEAPAMIPTARLGLETVSTRETETKSAIVVEKVTVMAEEDSKNSYAYDDFKTSIPDFAAYDEKFREHVKAQFRPRIEELTRMDKDVDVTYKEKQDAKANFKKEAQEFAYAYCKKALSNCSEKLLKDYVKYTIDDMYFYSVLTDLIERKDIQEISASWNEVYIIKEGEEVLTGLKFRDNQHMKNVIDNLTSFSNRKLNDTTPNIECRLPDKSRLSASIYPLSVYGTELSIRKFPEKPYDANDLMRFGTGNQELFDFMRAIVEAKKILVVTGGTASGKTTLLNALLMYLPEDKKKCIIENTHELNLPQRHTRYFEERTGDNPITMAQMLIQNLRKSPYCIVMGEVRGAEALEMYKAFNTGHFGLGTMHTNGAREYFDRAMTMILMNGIKWDDVSTKKYIADATNYIVHVSKMDDNSKKIVTISEVLGVDQRGAENLAKLQGRYNETVLHDFSKYGEGHVYLHDVYSFVEEGEDSAGKIVGYWKRSKYKPFYYADLNKKGLLTNYWENKGEV